MKRRRAKLGVVLVVFAVLGAACSFEFTTGDDADGPGDCTVVDVAVSSEKIDLMTDLAASFNDSDRAKGDDGCWFVQVQSKASGGAAQLLSEGWDELIEGPRPVIWSPAGSAWGAVVNERLSSSGEAPIVGDAPPFMLTPLVIAMPQPMAEALGWPDESIGFADILELSTGGEGWAAFGHPEWGPFKLGKTNPNFSTSGLSMAIAQYSALVGKTGDLSTEDLRRADVIASTEAIEQAVVHYGNTTLTFLNNWYRADERGAALAYASAAAVEEVSVIQYNQGNPDGVLSPGEVPVPPRVPLVAIYPEEGTVYSDNPFIILDAEWVDEVERAGAERFGEFVQLPENQQRVLDFGFRPGNPAVAIGAPVVAANGVDPNQPQALLEIPEPRVLVDLIDEWEEHRKGAQVMLLLDVSGSMGDRAAGGSRDTKLELAQRAIASALDQFADNDVISLRVFTSDLLDENGEVVDWVTLVPPAPISSNRSMLERSINGLIPLNGTPLYTAIGDGYADALAGFDPERINAIVVLSDGQNEDPFNADIEALLAQLRVGREGNPFPIRIFPIAYGDGADTATLRAIAEASDAALYTSRDPASIEKVFTQVVSNF